MVCYARPAIRMAAVVLVVILVFGRSVGHFFDAAALMAAIAVAAGGAAVAAALAFATFGSIRRRRAVAGGCVNCQFRCQHAMTEQPRRRLVVSTVDHGGAAGAGPGQRGAAVPRWPDRPAYRSGSAARPAVTSRPVAVPRPRVASPTAGQRERVLSDPGQAGRQSGRQIAVRRLLRELIRAAIGTMMEGLDGLLLRGDRPDLPGQFAAVHADPAERRDRPDPPPASTSGHSPGPPALAAGPVVFSRQPREPHATILAAGRGPVKFPSELASGQREDQVPGLQHD